MPQEHPAHEPEQDHETATALSEEIALFARHLRHEKARSEHTIRSYVGDLEELSAWMTARRRCGMGVAARRRRETPAR